MHASPCLPAGAAAALLVLGSVACGHETGRPQPAASTPRPAEGVPFVESAAASGLRFRHFNGWTGRRYDPEIMGSGVGILDIDGDGSMDVILLDGARLPGTPLPSVPPRTRVFHNRGDGSFEDVTDRSGIVYHGFAMGIAAGDIDGDGDTDVLITGYGRDALFRNRGDGTFEDVTDEAGVGDARWTVSAVFFDFDLDGDLDLYVTGYLDFDPDRFKPCTIRGRPAFCGPQSYGGIPDRLYRNDGHGRFTDVSREMGIADLAGKGLGVLAGDFDGDGDPDLYVANDGTPNFLLVNQLKQGRKGFDEEGVLLGAAYGEGAKAEAGMGVDAEDFDDDGDPDIVVTNLDDQTDSLYRNDGGFFLESSYPLGLGAPTLPLVGFGVRFLDYDLDGDLDLFVTNGHILDNVDALRQGSHFVEPNLLFENRDGHYTRVAAAGLPDGVGRGLATGDLDGDGDTDVVVSNNGRAPYLFRNVARKRGDAVGILLQGKPPAASRDALGARVSWEAWGRRRWREIRAGASYASTSDPRVLLAVPEATKTVPVTVHWPRGETETLTLAPGAYYRIVQGEGARERIPFRGAR